MKLINKEILEKAFEITKNKMPFIVNDMQLTNLDKRVFESVFEAYLAIEKGEEQLISIKLYTQDELFDMLNNVLETINIRSISTNAWNQYVKKDKYGKEYCVVHDVCIEDTRMLEDGRYPTVLIPIEYCTPTFISNP